MTIRFGSAKLFCFFWAKFIELTYLRAGRFIAGFFEIVGSDFFALFESTEGFTDEPYRSDSNSRRN